MSSNKLLGRSTPIPILLLKTRSQPHDTYEEYFSNLQASSTTTNTSNSLFQPLFVPVLEHQQNEATLKKLSHLLKTRMLKEQYGGMIFTSQRAVEAWADTVLAVEDEVVGGISSHGDSALNNSSPQASQAPYTATDTRTGENFETDILTSTSFPLYVVGPATGRALETLISTVHARHSSSALASNPTTSPFLSLNPSLHGANTGSGAVLAPFIQSHYNALNSEKWFIFHDAPRLPFIPLLGMGSENYSRRRLEPDDPRLVKRPLLFLVGEQRRDIIPKTLMDPGLGEDRIEVDEVEVYSTVVRSGFRDDFERCVGAGVEVGDAGSSVRQLPNSTVVVVVVFSPQVSDAMLKSLNLLDENGRLTEKAKNRWKAATSEPALGSETEAEPIHVIATIGPTTRDHLIDSFGFEPDVCAKTPSPKGIGEGILEFLREKGLL